MSVRRNRRRNDRRRADARRSSSAGLLRATLAREIPIGSLSRRKPKTEHVAAAFSASDLREDIEFEAIDGFDGRRSRRRVRRFPTLRRDHSRQAQEQRRRRVLPPPGSSPPARRLSEPSTRPLFQNWFRPHAIKTPGFVTAYYEVEVDAQIVARAGLHDPRPVASARSRHFERLAAFADLGRRPADRRPAPGGWRARALSRSARDRRGLGQVAERPLAFVRDPVELFLMQVQGSARLRFPDGGAIALTYDGRNGWPYTSVGRLMIERGLVSEAPMSLGRAEGEAARIWGWPGRSGPPADAAEQVLCFFRDRCIAERAALGPDRRPRRALTPFRSIAVDRWLWSYGLPFWISAREFRGTASAPTLSRD